MAILDTPFARLQLERYPQQNNSPLQAFNAADEYLLQRLHEQQLPEGARILVINDSFGALALSLAEHYQVSSCSDSFLAAQGLLSNGKANDLDANIEQVTQTRELNGEFAAVLIQIPKSLALLEDQLAGLQHLLKPDTLVLAGAMIKHLPRAAGDLLEKYIGPVQASLAWKKARLLQAHMTTKPALPQPKALHYSVPEYDLQLVNHAGTYSQERLDVGTRLLLQHLPDDLHEQTVADLGCGNGVLALACARLNPQAKFVLIDESHAAVRSAQENWRNTMASARRFFTGDGYILPPNIGPDYAIRLSPATNNDDFWRYACSVSTTLLEPRREYIDGCNRIWAIPLSQTLV